MKKNAIIFSIIFSIILLAGCSFNSTKENREEDKNEAEKVTKLFYALVQKNDKDEAYKLFSDKFFKVTDKNKLDQMIEWTKKEGGNFTNYQLSSWNTLIVKGTDSKSEYSLIYEVKRPLINTEEIFSLEKEKDKIKIVGYKINLDIPNNK